MEAELLVLLKQQIGYNSVLFGKPVVLTWMEEGESIREGVQMGRRGGLHTERVPFL